MEFIFGTKGAIEILKTKGSSHSDLKGWKQVENEYPDQTIVDRFYVVRPLKRDQDVEGNCYDWYEIDQHYRTQDKSKPVADKASAAIASIEDALCDQDEANEERISAIEDALCDLDTKEE